MKYKKYFDEGKGEMVFVVRDVIEVRIPRKIYERYARIYRDEEIISFCPHKNIYNHVTGRRMYSVSYTHLTLPTNREV